MELRKVDSKNVRELLKLSVREDQSEFVATNTESIVEAYTTITAGGIALPYGIYVENKPVGFLMLGYDCSDWEDAPAIAKGNYCIWRFMIDQSQQGRGYGRQAMALALKLAESRPCGDAQYCWLSYEPENTVAAALYHSFGFKENGEKDGDEIIAVRPMN